MAFAREKILLQFKNTNIQTTKYSTTKIYQYIYIRIQHIHHRMHNVNKKPLDFRQLNRT